MIYAVLSLSLIQLIAFLFLLKSVMRYRTEAIKNRNNEILREQIIIHKSIASLKESIETIETNTEKIDKEVSQLNQEVLNEVQSESVTDSMQTEYIPEQKALPTIKSVRFYQELAKQFVEIKRATMKADKDIYKQLHTSQSTMKPYLEQYNTELSKLREQCKANHRDKLKEITARKLSVKGKGGFNDSSRGTSS